MAPTLRACSSPTLRWWVQRNPAYVLSAACIACGARMLLVPEHKPPAGDVMLILATLGVLQAYEMLVTLILIALRHNIKAPEDQPSILIIAAIFWTGPLVATMEMTATNPTMGFALALGVVALAIGEVLSVAKTFGWKLGRSTILCAVTFLLIVSVAQPLLRASMATDGHSEILLYGLWWLVAGLMCVSSWILNPANDIRVRGGLVAAAAGASMIHLVAMNHAFVGHARAFYVTPVLAAVAMAALRFRLCIARREWLGAILLLPVLGIVLSIDRFSNAVVFDGPLLVYVDPLFVAFLLAGIVWWRGHVLLRWEWLRHAAAIALLWTATRGAFLHMARHGFTSDILANLIDNGRQGIGLLIAAWYLFATAWFRNSRALCAVGLVLQQIVISKLLPEIWSRSDFVCFASAGWSALIFIHVVARRSSLAWRLVPITYLSVTGWAYAAQSHWAAEVFFAKVHIAAMVVVLMVAGFAMRWTMYRTVATVIALLSTVPFAVQWVRHHPHGPATSVIAAGFALLVVGALISWNKQSLLGPDDRQPGVEDVADRVESLTDSQ
ncbi:MAG TPA: hypothetical protein PKN33_04820 [Phycisphaerae bacterium]|nr:hypothetical protein [Phycisphaerae bacterium]